MRDGGMGQVGMSRTTTGRRSQRWPVSFPSPIPDPASPYRPSLLAIDVAAWGDVRRHFWYHDIM